MNQFMYEHIRFFRVDDFNTECFMIMSCHPKYTAMPKRVKEGKQANMYCDERRVK